MSDESRMQTLENVVQMLKIALIAYQQKEFEVFASQIHMSSQMLEYFYPKVHE